MNKRSSMLFAVAAAAIVVYVNSLWNGFAYDDTWIVLRNERVHQLQDLASIWLTPYWPTFGSELGLYRPLTIFMFALQWAIGGGEPWVFHLTNVLLHTGCTLLVFLLIERLIGAPAAFAGALIFAVHPLHTEAVANVVGQGELLAALGVLAACVLYVNRAPGVGTTWRMRAALFVLYALALLAKESAVVLPGLLVLLDFAQRRVRLQREGLMPYVRAVAFPLVMFSAILFAYLLVRLSVLGNLTGTDAAPGLPWLREEFRVLNAFRAWPEFVRLLFMPFDLVVDYAPGVIFPVESLTPMVALGILLTFAAVTFMLVTPWRPRLGLPAGWFVVSILPVSNFFFPIGVLIAERTLYLPSVAVCFLAAYAWDAARQSAARETRRLALAGGLLIVVAFGVRTVTRNPDWDSLTSVWEALARDHPESYRAQWVNALSVWNAGRPDLAEKYFQLAEKVHPRDSQMLTEIGNFYIGRQRYDRAIAYLERSRDMTPFVPRTWEFLGYAYLYGGRPDDARRAALHANAMGGAHKALTYALLGGAYDALGRFGEAAGAWHAASRSRNGDLWLNHAMRARSLARAGFTAQALDVAELARRKGRPTARVDEVIDQLETAIRTGCYPHGTGCDPLQGWAITVGTPAATEKTGI